MFEYHCWALYVLFKKTRFQFEMVLHSLATEVPLPGPPNPPVMDESLTDLELFRKHCLPILDPWPEAGIYYCWCFHGLLLDEQVRMIWIDLDVLSQIMVKLLSGKFPLCSGGLRPGRAHVSCEVSGTMQTHEDPRWMGTLPFYLEALVLWNDLILEYTYSYLRVRVCVCVRVFVFMSACKETCIYTKHNSVYIYTYTIIFIYLFIYLPVRKHVCRRNKNATTRRRGRPGVAWENRN